MKMLERKGVLSKYTQTDFNMKMNGCQSGLVFFTH